ncbi:hypothetical protein NG829_10385 [Xanthomonas sacchari]|uniref:hypothetical protein n=1 Tax=Xanthomonas sacchari TaxID=56458 RepID=UPI00225E1879|nr:hypothetical protein [Xanthomonas sacchari]UYK82660.1 hypothetical protein NG829_10385 [Xanthomonas sacchari]
MSDQAPMPSRKTAPNVRLVDPLKTQAAAKAKDLGISLNALVALAVRQYLDAQAVALSQSFAHDALAQILSAGLDQELASPLAQRRVPRLPAASASGGRGARLPTKSAKRTGLRRRHGSKLQTFLTCPGRFAPSGIIGASFHHEYLMAESYSDRLWHSKGGSSAVWRDVLRNGKPL